MSSKQEQFTIATQNHREEHDADSLLSANSAPMRVVAHHQCNILKRNFILLLKENNTDPKQLFNCNDFITIFREILPSSPSDQVKKLFDILEPDDIIDANYDNETKTISFDGMLNNPQNFTKLLRSMCCVAEEESNDPRAQSDTEEERSHLSHTMLVHTYSMDDDDDDDFVEEVSTTQMRKEVYVMGALDENNTILPQLSWRHRISAQNAPASKQNTARSYHKSTRNANEYNQYMQQHKEQQLNELKNRVKELQAYEIKYNELQLILDTKNRQIAAQQEEIKQLTDDKDYYFEEVDNLRNKYDELLEQYTQLDDVNHHVTKAHQIQQQSTQLMEDQVAQLQTVYHESQEFGFKLREEKHQLDRLNTRYAEINDHLRNELETHKQTSRQLKQLLDTKDDEIRNITLESLTKDQKIQSLQVENQHMKQLDSFLSNGSLSHVHSKQLSRQSSFGWAYAATTLHGGSPRASAFDLFAEIDVSLYNGDGDRRSRRASEPIIALQEMEDDESDEKMSEAHDTNEYGDELNEHIKMRTIGTQTKTHKTHKKDELGFWDKLFRSAGYLCVPTESAFDNIPNDKIIM